MSLIYPAIDLLGGQCVRLFKGDYAQKTVYADNPVAMAKSFTDAGANWIHMVDLAGAKAGRPVQHELVASVQRQTSARIQCGGGIRTREAALELIRAGIARVVIGSLAVRDPKATLSLLEEVGPERMVLALDINFVSGSARLASEGWLKDEGKELFPVLNDYVSAGLKYVLCTDIGRDGTLEGPNLGLYESMLAEFPSLALQASGGVGSLENLKALKQLGVHGIIVGKALYDKTFTFEEAVAC